MQIWHTKKCEKCKSPQLYHPDIVHNTVILSYRKCERHGTIIMMKLMRIIQRIIPRSTSDTTQNPIEIKDDPNPSDLQLFSAIPMEKTDLLFYHMSAAQSHSTNRWWTVSRWASRRSSRRRCWGDGCIVSWLWCSALREMEWCLNVGIAQSHLNWKKVTRSSISIQTNTVCSCHTVSTKTCICVQARYCPLRHTWLAWLAIQSSRPNIEATRIQSQRARGRPATTSEDYA